MLWEMNNPDRGYLDDCEIHSFIDKEALMNFIMMETSDLKVVDDNSRMFHDRVKMFFKIHKWNIDKLCESLQFDYLPLNNYHGTEDRTLARDVELDSVTDRDQTDDTVTDRDQTVNTVTDRDQTEDEHTARDISTVEDINKTQVMHDDTVTDRDWTETGSSDEQDVNYVSAFNDKESPELIGYDANGRPIYKFNDTEHDRQTIDISYNKNGTEDIGVVEDKNTTDTQKRDETVDDDTQRDLNLSEDINVDEVLAEDITRKDTLAEDIHRNDVTDEDVVQHWQKQGNNGQSYQSLIEEERQQAQFNIYKWILNHWFREMVISVW